MLLDSENINDNKINKIDIKNDEHRKLVESFPEKIERGFFSPKIHRDIFKTFFGIYGVLPINFTEKIIHINPEIIKVFENIFAKEIYSKYNEYMCIKHSEWLFFIEKNKNIPKKIRILPLQMENKTKKIGNTYIGKVIPKKIAIREIKIIGILGKINLSLGRFELPLWH